MIQLYDFEATDITDPRPTQIGMCRLSKDLKLIKSSCKESYVNPQKEISWVAMGLTGITNEMVENAPLYEEVLPKFKVYPDTKYVVCHNMSFDSRFFPEGFIPEGVRLLCTLKLARMLIDKAECENHQNATLYYYLGCYKNPFGKEYVDKTHTALSDILMTANVLQKLLELGELTISEAWSLLYDYKRCKGGKQYKTELWEDVVVKDYSYVEYTFNNVELDQEELDYLEGLLSEYEHVKVEQLDNITFGKLKGGKWSDAVKDDSSYVRWCLNNLSWRDEGQMEYVKGLLEKG